jgi:hypothetical protein
MVLVVIAAKYGELKNFGTRRDLTNWGDVELLMLLFSQVGRTSPRMKFWQRG